MSNLLFRVKKFARTLCIVCQFGPSYALTGHNFQSQTDSPLPSSLLCSNVNLPLNPAVSNHETVYLIMCQIKTHPAFSPDVHSILSLITTKVLYNIVHTSIHLLLPTPCWWPSLFSPSPSSIFATMNTLPHGCQCTALTYAPLIFNTMVRIF